jgi:hypothetical protein
MDADLDDLVWGVGHVCIAASSLEWSMAYCASVIRCAGDAWFVSVYAAPGQTRSEFQKLMRDVAARFPEHQADTERLVADAKYLLDQRNRVVHSAVASERDPDSRFHEAWHAKTDTIWPVDPVELRNLAHDLERCAREIDDFGTAWEERAERDGWPDLRTHST